jgi:hypothetical protein
MAATAAFSMVGILGASIAIRADRSSRQPIEGAAYIQPDSAQPSLVPGPASQVLLCGNFGLEQFRVDRVQAKVASDRRQFRSDGGCQLEIIATEKAGAVDGKTVCDVTPRLVEPSVEFAGKAGVSFTLDAIGPGCAELQFESSVTLVPPASRRPTNGQAILASFNPWTYMRLAGKITGQDVFNVDMIWNRPHLNWYQDGYHADSGAWWQDDGDDAWWYINYGFTTSNTSQSMVNSYQVSHSTGFHSDGFPTSAYADINASTNVTLTGYYNGYATCSFSHSYDGGAIYYPNLHWHSDECYWE